MTWTSLLSSILMGTGVKFWSRHGPKVQRPDSTSNSAPCAAQTMRSCAALRKACRRHGKGVPRCGQAFSQACRAPPWRTMNIVSLPHPSGSNPRDSPSRISSSRHSRIATAVNDHRLREAGHREPTFPDIEEGTPASCPHQPAWPAVATPGRAGPCRRRTRRGNPAAS